MITKLSSEASDPRMLRATFANEPRLRKRFHHDFVAFCEHFNVSI